VLQADVSVLKSDVKLLSGEVSGIQRDLAELSHNVDTGHQALLGAIGQLTSRFDQLTSRLEARGVI
jgi:hypothetical protein